LHRHGILDVEQVRAKVVKMFALLMHDQREEVHLNETHGMKLLHGRWIAGMSVPLGPCSGSLCNLCML